MKRNNWIFELTITGLLMALGILLPLIFHAVNLGGQVFLPMHLPVILGGFYLSILPVALLGLLTPILATLLTGMPPIPTVFAMMAELLTYVIVVSLLFNKLKWGVYPSLISAMILGRGVSILSNWIIIQLISGKSFDFLSFLSVLFVVGLPGIIIQLVLIPLLVKVIPRKEPAKLF